MRFTVQDGIYFTEGMPENCRSVGHVDLSVGGQLKALSDLKVLMAKEAQKKGGNAIVKFEYGQKQKFFSRDSIAMCGKGEIVIIDPSLAEANLIK